MTAPRLRAYIVKTPRHRALPSATRSYPHRSGQAFPVPNHRIGAQIADHFGLISGMRYCHRLEADRLRISHCQVSKSTNSKDSHALMRAWDRPSEDMLMNAGATYLIPHKVLQEFNWAALSRNGRRDE